MKKQLQNNVYTLRSEHALTQQELADKIGVTRQTVIAIEKGNYTPSVALALDIANFFHATVDDIFFYET
ncbi:MAG: transcriptional regulator [Candidatus Magasanikbacteria bacterium CG10_big_fil_rev_8_21_14_0_10_43_6]|uniref:Transcriptional regulator n=1 Tax=Candidatus Magasanikbacteria bacterium CG10_big_fil_rev_8_21_14_0_10_43_6 TaxID=1974650 RepID=A0A2M6W1T3_9BACT|nr:MAG: transcriptional regulator [Candidatus Magasanikbacteria bacterium CG10_big_fil_rev_8_21_14_0_10_43_6]